MPTDKAKSTSAKSRGVVRAGGSTKQAKSISRPTSGRRRPRRPSFDALTPEQRAVALIEAVVPLLEMLSVLDAVFTEDDALKEHARTSLGRCYETWKKVRLQLDPNWTPQRVKRGVSMTHLQRMAAEGQLS